MILMFWCAMTARLECAQMYDRDVAAKKYEAYKSRVMAGDLNFDWRDFRVAAALGQVGLASGCRQALRAIPP